MYLLKLTIGLWCILANSLLHGQGFTNVSEEMGINYDFETEEYGGGVSFVDFNQDGLDDLTFATHAGQFIRFHVNTGSGFTELEPLADDTSEVKQVLWVDYNNDGALDLYITSASQNKLYRNDGNLQLTEVTSDIGLDTPLLVTYAATWMDYDHDGFLDLFTSHRTSDHTGKITLYKNTGGERFEDYTIRSGLKNKGNSALSMTSLDYNNDGFTDLWLAQDWEQGNQLLKNNGNGTFTDVSWQSNTNQIMNSMTATVGDYNMDGWMDIYVTNTNAGNILLKNNGDETFTDVTEAMNVYIRSLTFGAAFVDVDNDIDPDFQVVGFQVNYTYENPGGNQPYIRRDDTWGLGSDKDFNNGLAIGDFNQDGYPDFVRNSVTRDGVTNSTNTLLRNNFSDNHYLTVQLEGTISNKDAVGAILTLYANNQKMLRRIACGESFSSQHAYTQFFGLGQQQIADSLVVHWPSGNRSVVTNISADQHLELTEPKVGCMDDKACNYQPTAETVNNQLCRYATEYMDCGGCLNDEDEDGVCDEQEVYGCTDAYSCSYNPLATESDGSCQYLESFPIDGSTGVDPLVLERYSYPQHPGSEYHWSLENGSVVMGQGTSAIDVFWHDTSQGLVTLTETNEDGCQSPMVQLEVAIGMVPLSVAEPGGLRLYPNPCSDILHIGTGGLNNGEMKQINIIDLSGKVYLTQTMHPRQNEIDITQLPTGIYLFSIESGGRVYQQKIRIER